MGRRHEVTVGDSPVRGNVRKADKRVASRLEKGVSAEECSSRNLSVKRHPNAKQINSSVGTFHIGAMNRLTHQILIPIKNIYKDIGEKVVKFMIKMLQIPLILSVSWYIIGSLVAFSVILWHKMSD